MACIFKRDGKGPWRVAYFDWDPKTGKKRRREASTRQGDRAVAEQMAARLEAKARQHRQEADDLVELRRRGLTDPVAERLADHSKTPLATHLDAYKAVLEGTRATPPTTSRRRSAAASASLTRAGSSSLTTSIPSMSAGGWPDSARPPG